MSASSMNFFAPLVGQNQAVELLTQAVTKNRIAPAYLFVGPDGVGRSLAAKCFAEQIVCANVPTNQQLQVQHRLQSGNHPDFLWVEPTYLHQGQRLFASEAAAAGLQRKAPPQIRLEQIREITQFLTRPPLSAPRNVVAIEQAQTMAESAANALLKTLEEPGKATLILIAPSTESLLPTLVSRCQRIPFYRLNLEGMTQVLQQAQAEILSQPQILAIAQGSPGKAIANWQQLKDIPPELLQALQVPPKSLKDALETARQIDKIDPAAQLWLVDYLQHCYWQQFLSGAISHSYLQELEQARTALLCYAQPRLVWECTLLAMRSPSLSLGTAGM